MGFMDSVSTFTKGLGEKAKGNYDVLTLNNKISSSEKEMNKLFGMLGKQYFDLHKDDPEEALAEVVNNIISTEASIEELKKLVEETKTATAAVQLTSPVQNDQAGNGGAGVNKKTCMFCGAPIDDDSVFCSVCGKKQEPVVEEPKDNEEEQAAENVTEEAPQAEDTRVFCPNCGTELDDDSVFCSVCGTKV